MVAASARNIRVAPCVSDAIADYERSILGLTESIQYIDGYARQIENALYLQVETEWTDRKPAHLSNEKKRQIAYDDLVTNNADLQQAYEQKAKLQHERALVQINRDAEHRAFQLKLLGQ
jgi:hypothetical protein